MTCNTKDLAEATKSLRDPGIYFVFIHMICEGDKYDRLMHACYDPIFLWDLFCRLSMDDEINKRNTFKVVDEWLGIFYDEKDHSAIKAELEELGGYEDWEVLYNVFLFPLDDFLNNNCECVCNGCPEKEKMMN